jgi:hypothetical protein
MMDWTSVHSVEYELSANFVPNTEDKRKLSGYRQSDEVLSIYQLLVIINTLQESLNAYRRNALGDHESEAFAPLGVRSVCTPWSPKVGPE